MTHLSLRRTCGQFLAVSTLALTSISSSSSFPDEETLRARVQDGYGSLPLSFEVNQGQADPAVQFRARGLGYTLFLTDREAVLALRSPSPEASRAVVRMTLVDAAPASPTGVDEFPGRSHYLLGNDPQRWHTDVRQYARVRYTGVYSGIDLVYYGNQGQLEYDFVVSAGADPRQVQLTWPGARDVRVSESGELVVAIDGGEIIQHKPVIYQNVDGVRQEIAGGYRLSDKHRVTFDVGAYDSSRELVIDPVLSFATYLGGSNRGSPNDGHEDFVRIAVDKHGHAYVFGTTSSDDFPTTDGSQRSGLTDLFITKLNRTGTGLEYSTYLGSSGLDIASGIAIDKHGLAYLTGQTSAADFPVTGGAFQPVSAGSSDGFVTKLNRDGTGFIYSSYLGGSGFDGGSGIAVDNDGSAYVSGMTVSTDFPIVPGALKAVAESVELFVAKVNSTGTGLVYSTYLGGSSTEEGGSLSPGGPSIAVDERGHAFVVGGTSSSDFPTTPDAAMPVSGGGFTDGFVTKLNRDGSALVYSTFIGGSDIELAFAVTLDRHGRAHVTGTTLSPDFPVTPDAFQPTGGGRVGGADGFVATISHDGAAFLHASYLGGDGADQGTGIAVDDDGRVHVVGATNSSNFPVTPDAFRSTGLGLDAFVTVVDWDDASLNFSTYLGGSAADSSGVIALDKKGNAYVAGRTFSFDFPTTPGAFQPSHAGDPTPGPVGTSDAFVVKIEHDRHKHHR